MKNVLEYLEQAAQLTPDKIAVDDGVNYMTYQELFHLSQRMGSAFVKRITPRKPIVVLAKKSAVTLAAMFGVVYAGCFYVMVDPTFPAHRIQEILKVLDASLMVTDESYHELLEQAGYTGEICYISQVFEEARNEERLKEIREQMKEIDLLYGIFTSGSTGTPKAIVVSHQAVIHFIDHFIQIFEITGNDCIGNQAPFDFDVSVKDIYASLAAGATLILIPKKLFSIPPRLLDYLCEKKVTTLIWAVSALCLVSALKGLSYKIPSHVNKVLFSGEVMPVKQLKLWQAALPEAQFVNLYGPTEITCNCMYYKVPADLGTSEKLPIGYSLPGRTVYLVDELGEQILEPGKMGELYVSGESLSDGYYHNEDETTKRFISDPINQETARRCYSTGDLGYYGLQGEMYFAGRKDFQIKHMGHRIELEELESAFHQVEGVEKSCCLFLENKNQIVAFYIGSAQEQVVHQALKEKLPVYMIPARIRKVAVMPLTKNGKTDRQYFMKQAGGR